MNIMTTNYNNNNDNSNKTLHFLCDKACKDNNLYELQGYKEIFACTWLLSVKNAVTLCLFCIEGRWVMVKAGVEWQCDVCL